MGGAGVCHSDLHLMSDFADGLLPWNPPFTLGHEGIEIYCEDLADAPVPGGGGGLGLDGGMADYLLVPDSRFLVPIPDGLDPVHAAPVTDAGLTPYHAIRRSLHKLTPDATAVVIGAGGLGQMAVQILKATSATAVIVVDTRESARDLAGRHGADLALAPDAGVVQTIREAAHGRGADLVLDFVGSDETLATAVATTRPLGDLTIVGIAGGSLAVSFFTVPYEVSIQTTYWGTRAELVEVLQLAARGRITPDLRAFPLEDALDAYRHLRAGDIDGRAVITPSPAYTG